MKKLFIFIIGMIVSAHFANSQLSENLKLWYNKPATLWNEALPIGNGRLGAMVYGNPTSEIIQLNEDTFWSGGPGDNNNSNALNALGDIRSLLFAGENQAAHNMANNNVKSSNGGAKYQPIGELKLDFPDHANFSNFHRELDIENAVFTMSYNVDGVTYTREVFASNPDELIVIRLSASEAGKLSFSGSLGGELQTSQQVIDENTLETTGTSSTHEGVTGQVKFDARAKFINTGGAMSQSDTSIVVNGADEVVILLSIATNFVNYNDISGDEVTKCADYISSVEDVDFDVLLNSHITDYQQYFNRLNLNLGSSSYSNYPTDARIQSFSTTNDPELATLFFQFARYLLISGSRPGTQPLNLQGIWNDNVSPPWDSKYTININIEMNYWPAEKTNLPEMHEPLIQMVRDLSVTGRETAQTMYGADGWAIHHNTDLWRVGGMIDGATWGMWPMGGTWLAQHLWEKYMYSGDEELLREVYPILKEACNFYESFLIEEPENNWLIVSPSISPENTPSHFPESVNIVYGATMDNQILYDLYSKTIRAAAILDVDSDLMVTFQNTLDRLPPMQIGQHGQLQEWIEDWDSPDDKHRHISHLYGLYPGNQISPYTTPELFDAARTSLIHRGDENRGWAMAWKVNCWARLLDGNHAYDLLVDQFQLANPAGGDGGTYPNLLDSYPPLQIDANFGHPAGIAEMLMQSYDGVVHIIPALPDAWPTGEVSGLRAYGGFEVDIKWNDMKASEITITSNLGGNCRIRVPNPIMFADGSMLSVASGENSNPFYFLNTVKNPVISSSAVLNETGVGTYYTYDFSTEPNTEYKIIGIANVELVDADVIEENPKQITIQLSEKLEETTTYEGLTVKLDDSIAAIASVSYDGSLDVLYVELVNEITNENEVTLSYEAGNIVSTLNAPLSEFENKLVDNLRSGSSPLITALQTNDDGQMVIGFFNKKMQLPTATDGLVLDAEYNETLNIDVTEISFYQDDSTALSFTLSERVYADYQLSLNYDNSLILSKDDGQLSTFVSKPVDNYSSGLPFELLGAEVDETGLFATFTFNREIGEVLDQSGYFLFNINGTYAYANSSVISDTSIQVFSSKSIFVNDTVKASYTPGNLVSTSGVLLEAFNEVFVENSSMLNYKIPGRIEAETHTDQSGTRLEDCSEGGQDLAYIHTDDWAEYTVEVEQDTVYKATFRLATANDGGVITVYVDDIRKSDIDVPNTGAWQTYESSSIDIKLDSGQHIIKLLFTNSFNVNWMEFEKEKPVVVPVVETVLNTMLLNGVHIYPNPVGNRLTIESDLFQYEELIVRDILGKVIFSHSGFAPKQSFEMNFSNGIYFLELINNQRSISKKIIKHE